MYSSVRAGVELIVIGLLPDETETGSDELTVWGLDDVSGDSLPMARKQLRGVERKRDDRLF